MGTTPIYGFPYPDPSDLVANYPALGQQLAEDIEDVLPTIGGMAPVAPTSIANTGGSASTSGNTTTFTAVTALSLNGIFSASYVNYVIFLNFTQSTTQTLSFRLRAAGTDNTTSNYSFATTTLNTSALSGTDVGNNQNAAVISINDSLQTGINWNIYGPFLSTGTPFTSQSFGVLSTRGYSGRPNVASSFDGLTLIPQSSNITGTVRVYGLKD